MCAAAHMLWWTRRLTRLTSGSYTILGTNKTRPDSLLMTIPTAHMAPRAAALTKTEERRPARRRRRRAVQASEVEQGVKEGGETVSEVALVSWLGEKWCNGGQNRSGG